MLENGYIQLHRSILRWEWYRDQNTKNLFLHLLLTANYEPQKWQGIVVERGQKITSYSALARETGLSVQNVRTAIKHLISTQEITYQATPKYGLVTITNYDEYQSVTAGQQSPNKVPTYCQQSPNNNGIKLIKNKKEKEENGGLAASPSGLPEGFTSEEEYIAFLRR